MQIAANGRNPPLVPHMPRHAAPGTNVVEGLGAAVRRILYQWPQCAETGFCKVWPRLALLGHVRPTAAVRDLCGEGSV